MGEETNSHVDTTYVKGDKAYEKLIEEAEGCPFCLPAFPGENKLLHQIDGWIIMKRLETLVPYPNTDKHLIILPERHVVSLAEVGPQEWMVIQRLIGFAILDFPIFQIGGGLVVRFGTNSGVTIKHIHFHLIAPVTNPETSKAYLGRHVDFPIG